MDAAQCITAFICCCEVTYNIKRSRTRSCDPGVFLCGFSSFATNFLYFSSVGPSQTRVFVPLCSLELKKCSSFISVRLVSFYRSVLPSVGQDEKCTSATSKMLVECKTLRILNVSTSVLRDLRYVSAQTNMHPLCEAATPFSGCITMHNRVLCIAKNNRSLNKNQIICFLFFSLAPDFSFKQVSLLTCQQSRLLSSCQLHTRYATLSFFLIVSPPQGKRNYNLARGVDF